MTGVAVVTTGTLMACKAPVRPAPSDILTFSFIQRCYQDQGVRDQDQTKTRQAETKTETKTREAETKTKTKTSRVETKTKTKTSKSGLDRSRDQDQGSRYVRNVVV